MSAAIRRDRASGMWVARWMENGEHCSYSSPDRTRVLAFIAVASAAAAWRQKSGVAS